MKIILECHSNDENDSEIAHAVVHLDGGDVAQILSRGEVFRTLRASDGDLATIDFSSLTCRFYENDERCEALLEASDTANVFVADDFETDGGEEDDGERTECDTLVIEGDRFWWRCYPKHSSTRVETESVGYEELSAAWAKWKGTKS